MRALTCWLSLCLLLGGVAQGATMPYTHWLLDVKRAGADAARLTALATSDPSHAFTWLSAHVFDLATPGVPVPERQRIRGIAEPLAATLLARGERAPQLWLDAAAEDQLAPLAAAVRAARAKALQADLREPMRSLLPLLTTRGDVARALVHGLLHGALRDRKRLGGAQQSEMMLTVARRLAADYAELTGDIGPWRAVLDAQAPPQPTLPSARAELQGLQAWAAGDLAAAGAAFAEARALEISRRGATLRTGLLRGAGAWLLAAPEQAKAAEAERQAQVVELGTVPLPWPQQRARLAHAHALLRLAQPDAAASEAALLAEAANTMDDPDALDALLVLADGLRAAGAERVQAGDLAGAERLLKAAEGLYGPLRARGVIERSVPVSQRAQATRERAQSAGQAALDRAAAAWGAGRLTLALERAQAAAEIFPEGTQANAWAAVTRYALATGLIAEADRAASLADAGLADRPVDRARHRAVMARLRLLQGRLAPAFGFANAALRGLREAGEAAAQAPLRAQLHHVAADALAAAGYGVEAEARLAFAVQVHPDEAAQLALADARAARGDLAGALAGLGDGRSTPLRVARGCLAAAMGDGARALMETEGIFPRDPTWAQRRAVCRAKAFLAKGDRGAAGTALGRAATFEGPHTAPIDRYRHALVAAALEAGQREITRLREALAAWRAGRGDDLGLPGDGFVRWTGGPAPVIARLAERAGGLAEAVWWARQQAAVSRPGPDAAAVRAARGAVAGWSAALARAGTDPDRAHAQDRLAVARRRLADARVARAAVDPRWARLVRPAEVDDAELLATAGVARLYYQTGPAGGRLWLMVPGQPVPQSWALAGHEALAAVVGQVRAAYASPAPWPADGTDPHLGAWGEVQRAGAALVPWAREPAVVAALQGLTLVVWADGPLRDFPFETMVLAPPAEAGRAPDFVGARWPVVYRGPGAALPVNGGQGFARAGAVGPDDEALAGALAGAATRLVDGDVAAAQRAGTAWITGPLSDAQWRAPGALSTLVLADAAAHPALLRWAGVRDVLAPTGLAPTGDPRAVAALWARLAGRAPALTLQFEAGDDGVRGSLTPVWRPGAGPDLPLAEALAAWRADALSRAPVVGEVPRFHPTHWARWRWLQP